MKNLNQHVTWGSAWLSCFYYMLLKIKNEHVNVHENQNEHVTWLNE